MKNSANKNYRVIQKILDSFNINQDNYLIILGGLTGILGGIGAIIFRLSIHFIESLFFHKSAVLFNHHSLLEIEENYPVYIFIILIPAIGGLLVGLLSYYFEKGEKGEGIPSVIDSIISKGGIIKGWIAIKKIIGSALSIGTGGAGGKEGPIVQIGASIGSWFGQILKLPQDKLKILVGCGAAAGLSAAFNAPLGGAIFSMEIILRTFDAKTFSPIIVASVFGTALSRIYLGDDSVFDVQEYHLNSFSELSFYVVFGILSGLTSVYFVKVFYFIEDIFQSLKHFKPYLKPAIGGLFVGIIGFFLPGIYGFSYNAFTEVFTNKLSFLVVLLLLVFKPIATSLTISSGGNGGTFAPSLFTGAMLGGAFGMIANYFFPQLNIQPGAFALVGMAGVVAGTTHASLTALVMTFEMTDNFKIILPLMLTIIISTTVSKAILNGNLYSIKFQREGKDIDVYGRKTSILRNLIIQNIYIQSFDYVVENDSFNTILEKFKKSYYNIILVMNSERKIIGYISFQNLRDVLLDEDTRSITNFLIATDIMNTRIDYVNLNDNAEFTLKAMDKIDIDLLPVINENKDVIGIISRERILDSYQKETFIKENEETHL